MTTSVQIDNLSKCYQLGVTHAHTLREVGRQAYRSLASCLLGRRKAAMPLGESPSTLWALKDLSLQVKQGETLAVIGPNGGGKSTLLKILSRITLPSKGTVEVFGRIASLLEVGTGFHPELTGRENVYLNGTILGMTRSEVNRQFDAIVDFAGVEQFLDTPVKRYSSGMRVRLGFAVAAHLEPDILIVDEVLAVGDQQFQQKCLGKMHQEAQSGRTVLFVSHNMSSVSQLCQQGLVLNKGRTRGVVPVAEAIDQYAASFPSGHRDGLYEASGSQEPAFFSRIVIEQQGETRSTVLDDQPSEIEIALSSVHACPTDRLFVTVCNQYRQHVFSASRLIDHMERRGDQYVIRMQVNEQFLIAGSYSLNASLLTSGNDVREHLAGICGFRVASVAESGLNSFHLQNDLVLGQYQWH